MQYSYHCLFKVGDKVVLKYPISVRVFTGGFKDVFKLNDSGYTYKTIQNNIPLEVIKRAVNELYPKNSQITYTLKIDDDNICTDIPEYILEPFKM